MRRRRAGRIVNVSSLNGRIGQGAVSAYSASKFAVEGFSEALAFEARPFGIDVVVIEPGMFNTEIFHSNLRLVVGAADSPFTSVMPRINTRLATLIERVAGDPQRVADVVLRALTVRRPRLRYVVGSDARLQLWLYRLAGFSVYAKVMYRISGLQPEDIAG
jgi:NAD(P)-dependent dehydrogenase (short-subunit alcohol dehydrogenase family)